MVWKSLEFLGSLLEPEERQSVLGDIQERGAGLRALIELCGLVLFRQLQGWQVWFPWLMTMMLPVFNVVFGALTVGESAWRVSYMGTGDATLTVTALIGVPLLAWASGFSLGSIGKLRTVIVLPLLVFFFAVFARGEAEKLTQHGFYGVATVGGAVLTLTVIPMLAGFVRGVREAPLPRHVVTILTCVAVLCAAVLVPAAASGLGRTGLLFVAPSLWPLFYAFSKLARNLSEEATHAR